jgi:hypothetical protein
LSVVFRPVGRKTTDKEEKYHFMSTTSPAAEAPWTNVQIEMEPEPTISYRSAMTVYEESLLRGRFVGRGWNGAGYMSFYGDVRLDPTKHASPLNHPARAGVLLAGL